MHCDWAIETTYFSIKASLLDGRVLRSHSVDGIEQEVWALLTVYQVLVRAAADAIADRPDLDMDRLSFTVLLQAAADTVVTATGLGTDGTVDLAGAIGQALLAALWPARRRRRTKARSKKNATSKYQANYGRHPQRAQHYTVRTDIEVFKAQIAARPRR